MNVSEFDLRLDGCRTLHVYDTAPEATDALTIFWQHGTPNLGAPPRPLVAASERLGLRWVSYDRPGYGGSTPVPGRDVASAAFYVSAVADALGIGRFAVVGHSGGGSHALACGVSPAGRVLGVVAVAALAPYDAAGLDWFAGMADGGAASLRAAARGRAAKERHEAEAGFDPEMFTPADHVALAAEWSWFDEVVDPAVAQGPGGLIDDDLAYVAPWGFDPSGITVPVLLLHGDQDRIVPAAHARWLARRCPTATARLSPDDGHISVLRSAAPALEWLHSLAGAAS
ncbi:alpha/beta fold hydrolase [Actinomadura sp. NEAU-AAG7]|uniref:alpha/beta fold hydrolase n=1 Tax=Actinomadura sp. NEAU-AAG7 TaxID=2839640 RepID=UPI001BE48CCE|nr:alpha/beta hydrolase [Actinomadura sp. NEAU-AAG7]MBT2208826.1 alpha/beta hydrolase [Actinomadura sp. NEAU-AAG7]